MPRIGPRMAQVVAYVEARPECSFIDCARHVAPERFWRVGLSFGYKSVHRAIHARLVDTRPHPTVRSRRLLVPAMVAP